MARIILATTEHIDEFITLRMQCLEELDEFETSEQYQLVKEERI